MQAINKNQLFLASRIALIFTAMTFAFRAGLEGVWSTEFSLTKEQLGWIFSPAFYGFTLAMIFGGPLCDVIGMKTIACTCICWTYSRSGRLPDCKRCDHAFCRHFMYWYRKWNG
jgi:MFS family permease